MLFIIFTVSYNSLIKIKDVMDVEEKTYNPREKFSRSIGQIKYVIKNQYSL